MLRTAFAGLLDDCLGDLQGGDRIGAMADAVGKLGDRIDEAAGIAAGGEQRILARRHQGERLRGCRDDDVRAPQQALRRRRAAPRSRSAGRRPPGCSSDGAIATAICRAASASRNSPTAQRTGALAAIESAGSTTSATPPDAAAAGGAGMPSAPIPAAMLVRLRKSRRSMWLRFMTASQYLIGAKKPRGR